jgi:dsDNA-specific endonuclease/ATPase MutS2
MMRMAYGHDLTIRHLPYAIRDLLPMNPPMPTESDDEREQEEPVRLPIEDSLDLHAFAPRDISAVVSDYLGECARHGIAEVRLIHGRGTGAQRAIVRSVLARHPLVEGFADAPPERGGWGATIVRLRGVPLPT